jgi:hypothetical protein
MKSDEEVRAQNERINLLAKEINSLAKKKAVAMFPDELALHHEFAAMDGATIQQYVEWIAGDRLHSTALGHWANGDVWVHTVTMPCRLDKQEETGA